MKRKSTSYLDIENYQAHIENLDRKEAMRRIQDEAYTPTEYEASYTEPQKETQIKKDDWSMDEYYWDKTEQRTGNSNDTPQGKDFSPILGIIIFAILIFGGIYIAVNYL